MNGIAGQSVLARQRGKMAVFESTQAAIGGGPKRTAGIESQVVDTALAQAIGGYVRCPYLTVTEVRYASVIKSRKSPLIAA